MVEGEENIFLVSGEIEGNEREGEEWRENGVMAGGECV